MWPDGHETRLTWLNKNFLFSGDSRRKFIEQVKAVVKKNKAISKKLAHSIFVGPPESGKTTLMDNLLLRPKKLFSPSTGVSDPVVVVDLDTDDPSTFHSARVIDASTWREVDYDTSLAHQMYIESDTGSILTAPAQSNSKKGTGNSHASIPSSPLPNKTQELAEVHTPAFELSDSDISKLIDNVLKKCGSIEELQSFLSEISLYLRDTGGHMVFQEMLSVLILGPSMVIFVFRVDRDIKEEFVVQYRVSRDPSSNYTTSSISTEKALLQCLASVYAMDTSFKAGVQTHEPQVFIVGTHKDKLGPSADDKIAEVNKTLGTLIENSTCFQDLVQYADRQKGEIMFLVDNTSESDEDFKPIRSKIHSFVSGREEFTIEYPINYLLFSLELHYHKRSILSLEECERIAAKYGILGDKVSHLLQFLQHRVGVIQYFSCANLIMVKPGVLFSKVTDLVKKTFFRESLSSKEARYFERGILTASVIRDVIEGNDLISEKFLQLLIDLHIITPIAINDREERYFIPCVLKQAPSPTEEDYKEELWPLYVKFKCGHCPKGLFGVLVACLMKENTDRDLHFRLTDDLDKICKDHVYFEVHSPTDRDEISLRAFPFHLRICFFPSVQKDRDVSTTEVCVAIRQEIEKVIEKSLEHLCYDNAKVGSALYFKCDECKEFHEIVKGKSYYKMHCKQRPENSQIPSSGKCWFSEGQYTLRSRGVQAVRTPFLPPPPPLLRNCPSTPPPFEENCC